MSIEINRPYTKDELLVLYRTILNMIHFEAGNIFYNKPGFEVYKHIALLASDLRRQPNVP
jgi:hypothetical protein